jgi:soluble lytic murein transglycosylase-like protein
VKPRFKSICLTALLAGGGVLSSAPVGAEIFKYVDQAGNVTFTDRPMKKKSGLVQVWRSANDPRFASYSRIDTRALQRNRKLFTPLIREIAERHQLQPALIHAVVQAESAYDPKALSKKGARGLMQLMPATAARYAVSDTWNPKQNLEGGVRYLKDLLAMFKNDLTLAIAAYNAGENAVKRAGNKVPPYAETQRYVRKVLGFYRQGTKLAAAYPTIR